MLVNKILRNQILKIVKEAIGVNDNKWELRKFQNELRSLSGRVARMEKNSHPKRELVERKGKYYLEEKSEE